MLHAGIDEAGRGALLGPLVLALVCLPEASISLLEELGVKDSKVLSPLERSRLHQEIKHLARKAEGFVAYKCLSPGEIDRFRQSRKPGGINELERRAALELVYSFFSLRPVVSDGLTVFLDGEKIFSNLSRVWPQEPKVIFRAENRADETYPIVSAASIIAKHERDLRLKKIFSRYAPEFGPIGGNGYPNSETMKFIREYQRRYGGFPSEARKTWKTLCPPEPRQSLLPFPEEKV
jgi:ribonuclease HII